MSEPSSVPVVEQLVAIEDIKRLKARYLRAMDSRLWDELRDTFTDDARFELRRGPGEDPVRIETPDAYIELIRTALDGAVSVHHAHMPEIDLTGTRAAEGVWTLEDCIVPTGSDGSPEIGRAVYGYSRYLETYQRQSDGWRIASLVLERVLKLPLAPATGR